MRIVILEDMASVYMIYKLALSGFDVEHAPNFSVLEVTENKDTVDVVVMDYHIDGDSFDDSLEYVKKQFPKAKRLLISGHVESMNLRERYNNEFSLILSKPLDDLTEFKGMIADVVNSGAKRAV